MCDGDWERGFKCQGLCYLMIYTIPYVASGSLSLSPMKEIRMKWKLLPSKASRKIISLHSMFFLPTFHIALGKGITQLNKLLKISDFRFPRAELNQITY